MIIAEFCSGRGVDSQAIRKYIMRHPELFEGHTGKHGREITLDDFAIDVLSQKYPLLKPVEVISGVDPDEHKEVLKELNRVKDLLLEADKSRSKLEIELNNKNVALFLLEQKKEEEVQEKERLKDVLEASEKANKELREQQVEMQSKFEQELNAVKNELEKERQKTWLQKLFRH